MTDDGKNRGVDLEEKIETKEPSMYKVLLHNDDYTTMEFVVFVLKKVFHKSQEEAEMIMMSVHKQGTGLCGVYTYEVAESKVFKVTQLAKEQEHPLKCTMEEE